MRFDVFTLFPGVFQPYLEASIMQRAIRNQLLAVNIHDIRNWTTDRHHTADDTPYGGGGGMVMKAQPIFAAVEEVLAPFPQARVILMTPQGRPFTQQAAVKLYQDYSHIALVCGHYEGVDERVREHLVHDEISIGDYVLTGGELPAMIVIDALARLIPGTLGDPEGWQDDSHASGLLEYPHYTRPPEFRGWKVPEMLLSGNHAAIERWRREQALRRTLQRRPDMLERAQLSDADCKFLQLLLEEKKRIDSQQNEE